MLYFYADRPSHTSEVPRLQHILICLPFFTKVNFIFISNCNKSNNALSIRGQNAITILPVTLQKGGWEREYNLLTFKR